jgi:hypothetical protein
MTFPVVFRVVSDLPKSCPDASDLVVVMGCKDDDADAIASEVADFFTTLWSLWLTIKLI